MDDSMDWLKDVLNNFAGQKPHPGLSKIPRGLGPGGPGSDIIKLGITIEGQKLGAGRLLIPGAGRGLTICLPKFASAF